jgi:hypothetical protein
MVTSLGARNFIADLGRRLQTDKHLPEAVESSFEVFNDLLCQIVRLWQVIEVCEALVFKPEDVEARLVARGQLLVSELAPATFRVLFGIPSCFALLSVLRIVTIDEVSKVLKTERLLQALIDNVKKPDTQD